MARAAHPSTLFHLVPRNQVAYEALRHPDNQLFISRSKQGPGLEVGFHVPHKPGGHVITRLGRNADLILRQNTPQNPMSAVHVAFEFVEATNLVRMSVRSKVASSVRFMEVKGNDENSSPPDAIQEDVFGEEIIGDGIILYGQNYEILISSYRFRLVWRTCSSHNEAKNTDSLRAYTIECFKKARQQLKTMASRDRPTENDESEARSWHVTRLQTGKNPLFQDIETCRVKIGKGSFGNVFRAVDRISGQHFAIKVVKLSGDQNAIQAARGLLHREIKVMERVKHEHIIEYLGSRRLDTHLPEILMPLCEGTLTSLGKSLLEDVDRDLILVEVAGQILSALDYLASRTLIHRDLKPDNILYTSLGENRYRFQLADFGLANYNSLAKMICGTGYYQAPELHPNFSRIYVEHQSPKMDIWSLFASLVAVHSRFTDFPPLTSDYRAVLNTLMVKAQAVPRLRLMARLHPDHRASAAQMLLVLFNGQGLTTPRHKVPPIPAIALEAPIAGPRNRTPVSDDRRAAPQRQRESNPPWIRVPPRMRDPALPTPGKRTARSRQPMWNRAGNLARPALPKLLPTRTHVDGVARSRPEPRASRATTPVGILREQKQLVPVAPLPKQDAPLFKRSTSILRRVPGAFID